ncbi:MAG: hypothetical protein AAF802_21190 [Planctomycetota bacterium]
MRNSRIPRPVFSLRSLVLGATVIAAMLAVLAKLHRDDRREANAWKLIEASSTKLHGWPTGIEVEDFYRSDVDESSIAELGTLGRLFAPGIKYLRINQGRIDVQPCAQTSLENIGDYRQLEFLDIRKGQFSSTDAERVTEVPRLTELQFERVAICPDALSEAVADHICAVSFTACFFNTTDPRTTATMHLPARVRISRPATPNFASKVLCGDTRLQRVAVLQILNDGSFTGKELRCLSASSVRSLWIASCDRFDTAHIEKLLDHSMLREFSLWQTERSWPEVASIRGLDQLETLDLFLDAITEDLVSDISKMGNLNQLGLRFKDPLNDDQAGLLSCLNNIKVLSLGRCAGISVDSMLTAVGKLRINTLIFQDKKSFEKFATPIKNAFPEIGCQRANRPIGLSKWTMLGT